MAVLSLTCDPGGAAAALCGVGLCDCSVARTHCVVSADGQKEDCGGGRSVK